MFMLENLEFKKNWAGKWTLLECFYLGGDSRIPLQD